MLRRGSLGILSLLLTAALFSYPHVLAWDLPGDYFPDGTIDKGTVTDWYGKYLHAMHEPSLYKISRKDTSAQIYRVTYFPPYSSYVAMTLTLSSNGSGLLDLKKMEQIEVNGFYEPGRMTREATFVISTQAVNHFQRLLKDIHFDHLPSQPKPHGPAVLGGDMFLYESADKGKYHVVEAPYPENPELLSPGQYLMKLAYEREPD